MPIRLIGILIVAVAVTLFSAFNFENKCDIWLFHEFKDIPVTVTIMISLFAGVIITLPFTFGRKVKRGEVLVKKSEIKKQQEEKKLTKNLKTPLKTSDSINNKEVIKDSNIQSTNSLQNQQSTQNIQEPSKKQKTSKFNLFKHK